PAARPAPLDHLVAEPRAPLPVIDLLRPFADLGREAAQGEKPFVLTHRPIDHLARASLDRAARPLPNVADLRSVGDREHVAFEHYHRMLAVPGAREVLQPGGLKLLESGIGQVGDL